LAGIIRNGREKELSPALSAFSCQDEDVESFLKNKAAEHELRKKSRTFVIFEDENESKVLAYFTLSLKILKLKDDVSKTLAREIDGFNKNAKAVPVMLIGQFGKDKTAAKRLRGDYLMALCKYQLSGAQDIVGGRVALVEYLPIEPVISFYERNGFKFLQKDENDKYHQMILAF
jgi:hypothetical protein